MITVDLDNNNVSIPDEYPLPKVPAGAMTHLKNSLKKAIFPELRQLGRIDTNEDKTPHELEEIEIQKQKQIRLCFLAFYVYLFRDIKKYLNVGLEDTEDVFDIDNFLKVKISKNKKKQQNENEEDKIDEPLLEDDIPQPLQATDSATPTVTNPYDRKYSEFWDILLKTKMSEIFTQKLANKNESKLSMGLFIELTTKVSNCSNHEIFDIVIHHSIPKKDPTHVISMNNPKALDPISLQWNPNYFPPLDEKLLIPQENSNALLEVKYAIRKAKKPSTQLFFLYSQLQVQKYFFTKDIKYIHNAFSSCIDSIQMDENSIPEWYISCLLEFCNTDELEKLEASCPIVSISKEIREIIENRIVVFPTGGGDETGGESSEDDDNFECVPNYALPTGTDDIINSLKVNLQYPIKYDKFIKRDNYTSSSPLSLSKNAPSISTPTVIQICLDLNIIPDDPVTKSK